MLSLPMQLVACEFDCSRFNISSPMMSLPQQSDLVRETTILVHLSRRVSRSLVTLLRMKGPFKKLRKKVKLFFYGEDTVWDQCSGNDVYERRYTQRYWDIPDKRSPEGALSGDPVSVRMRREAHERKPTRG